MWLKEMALGVRRPALGWIAVLAIALMGSVTVAASEPFDSQRLAKAKDFIAEEQWLRAIEELKAAAGDPKEPNKDEALFWLAHSQNQARDSAAAVETIRRLEREHPSSRWVKPARSLRVEIAQRLGRYDVLWFTAGPNIVVKDGKVVTVETAPVAITPMPTGPVPVEPVHGARPTQPPTVAPPPPTRPAPGGNPRPPSTPVPGTVAPPPAPQFWFAETYRPDGYERIYALRSLLRTDAEKVIPMLKEIALHSGNPAEARSAVLVLAQANRPDARMTVVEVARTAAEPVQIAAVRELGRLGGPTIATELLQVYSSGNTRVKYQVVSSLGERAATEALYRIAASEKERELRDQAIRTLGQAGGRRHLSTLYARAPVDARRAIILGLFNARGDEELIAIAQNERDTLLRQEVLTRLRLLGTPQARQFLQEVK